MTSPDERFDDAYREEIPERQIADWNEHNAAIDLGFQDGPPVIEYQEANEMPSNDTPTVTVIGNLPGGNKLVRAEWNGQTQSLSIRALNSLTKLGMTVVDEESNYVF